MGSLRNETVPVLQGVRLAGYVRLCSEAIERDSKDRLGRDLFKKGRVKVCRVRNAAGWCSSQRVRLLSWHRRVWPQLARPVRFRRAVRRDSRARSALTLHDASRRRPPVMASEVLGGRAAPEVCEAPGVCGESPGGPVPGAGPEPGAREAKGANRGCRASRARPAQRARKDPPGRRALMDRQVPKALLDPPALRGRLVQRAPPAPPDRPVRRAEDCRSTHTSTTSARGSYRSKPTSSSIRTAS